MATNYPKVDEKKKRTHTRQTRITAQSSSIYSIRACIANVQAGSKLAKDCSLWAGTDFSVLQKCATSGIGKSLMAQVGESGFARICQFSELTSI